MKDRSEKEPEAPRIEIWFDDENMKARGYWVISKRAHDLHIHTLRLVDADRYLAAVRLALGVGKASGLSVVELDGNGLEETLWEPGECTACGLVVPDGDVVDPTEHNVNGERVCIKCHAEILATDSDIRCNGCPR